MQAQHIRKSSGKVIPMRRFASAHDEELTCPFPSTPAQRREDFIREQIVVTLKNLLESLRPLKS